MSTQLLEACFLLDCQHLNLLEYVITCNKYVWKVLIPLTIVSRIKDTFFS